MGNFIYLAGRLKRLAASEEPNHLGAADRGYARPILRILAVELPGGNPTRLTVIIPYSVQNVM